MKRGLVLIAGALVVVGTSFYISTRLLHPPTPAAVVAMLKQAKLTIISALFSLVLASSRMSPATCMICLFKSPLIAKLLLGLF